MPSFVDTYQNEVKAMKLLILKYMQAIKTKQTQPEVPFGFGNNPSQPKYRLQFTEAGFPLLAVPLPSHGWKKQDWEDLFSAYMGQHYSECPALLQGLAS